MAEIDLNYKNKEGISLQDVLDIVTDKISKKELTLKLDAKKSIDTLIKKLIDANLLFKVTEGRHVFYIPVITQKTYKKKSNKSTSKKVSKKKSNKSTPKKVSKKKVDEIKTTEVISKKHEITSFVEMEEETISSKNESVEIDKSSLNLVKDDKDDKDIINQDNPYRFVLNFFVTTLNGELATNYFRRRDNYVVKSIYNKFKTMCEKVEDYDTEQQHLPFYRAITICRDEMTVKMYHIDMNRTIRGIHTIFKIDSSDIPLIFGSSKEQKIEY